jgi:outer membrane protein assembly factor BamB
MYRAVRLTGRSLVSALVVCLSAVSVASAQGRGGGNWPTAGSDPQRTSWVRADAKISPESLQQPGFQLLWKATLENQNRQLVSLTQPLLLQNIISYKGFKALAFVGGSADNVYSIDYDLNRMFWKVHLSSGVSAAGTAACPGALTSITRAAAITPPAPAGRGGRGGGGGGGFGGGNTNVYAISSGGMVHVLNVQTGEDLNPPIKFLPAGAQVVGTMAAGTTLYAATTGACGGAANGVYALDMANNANTAKSWDAKGAAIAGNVAPTFGTDGTIYVATGAGGSEFANAVVALDGTGLTAKDWFTAATPFMSAPVVFQHQGKDVVAAANSDGRIYLLDASSLGGADHKTPLAKSPQYAAAGDFQAGALSTWQDAAGTRWIAVPSGAAPAGEVKAAAANGAVTSGALVAFKLGAGATPTLEPGWISRDLVSPTAPLVMNGVVFVVSGGGAPSTPQMTPAQRAQRSKPAVLYALDASTGKELWTSGTAMTSPVFGVAPSGGDGQVYVVTHDGTVYAFGMPMER